MSGGPVQLMAFGYGSAVGAEDRIMAELDALQGRGVLRLLDFLFVQKTEDGSLAMLDVGDDEDYGTILSGFFPFEDEGSPATADVDPDELADLASSLRPGTAMALVLVEHLWAGRLFSAVEEYGGELLSEGFITDEGEVLIGAETQALSEAAEAVEAAHAEEAAARLAALQAADDAAAAIDAAERVRSAAAAEALSALIEAGIVEAEAADEAADALVEAGVITAAADEAEELPAETVVAASQRADAAVRSAAQVEMEAEEEEAAAMAAADAVERAEAQALGEVERGGQDFLRRHDAVDQPHLERAGGADRLAEQHDFHGLRPGDLARQPDQRAAARDQAPAYFGEREGSRTGHHA